MKTILTRMFTVVVLMMIGMAARADVKVLYGEKGTDKFEGKGGSIKIEQADSKVDKTKVTVYLTFIPQSGYTFDEKSLEVYAVISTDGVSTRAPEISGDPLKLTEEKTDVPSAKRYSVDIDSNLGLWVRTANFTNARKGEGDKTVTYHIINLGRLDNTGQITSTRTEALQFTVTGDNVTVGVPAEYKSPLAKEWVYYNSSDVTYDATTKECTFDAGPSLNVGDPLSDGDHVFVAYVLDEAAFSTVGLTNGGIYRIQFPNGKYFRQDTYKTEINANSYPSNDPTDSKFLLRFNIVDPYQITLQSQSTACLDYYLSVTSDSNFGNVRFINTLSTAQANKVWAFALLPGSASDTYRLVVADGMTQSANVDGRDEFGHGYLNNYDAGYKIRYHKYEGNAHNSCDLKFMPMNVNYVYNIVDTEGHIAIQCAVTHGAGKALSGYNEIPEAIRSPYIEDETVTFYTTFSAQGSRNNLSDPITYSPVGGGNIYVSYTTSHLKDQPLHLRGERKFQMQVNGEYVYDNGGTLANTSSTVDIGNSNYQWKFSGLDPYRVQIQNAGNDGRYLNWSTSPSASLSLDASCTSHFIFFGGNAARPDGVPSGQTDQIELMAATGEDAATAYHNVGRASNIDLLASGTYGHANPAVQVLLKAEERSMTFHIIDKSGRIVIEESGNYGDVVVPRQWQSPLVSEYHYYRAEDFTVSEDVYTLNGTPAEISSIIGAPSDIYVTYDISDDYDLDGSENRASDGKKYLLKFAGGTSFRQEKGDGFEDTAAPGIYPYINGEGGLFVYGQAKLDAQAGEVASTRTRWAWYLEGGDPYRLRISSLQTKTDGKEETHHSYLRTYKPQGYTEVVTGVISDNPTVYDASDDAHAERHKPTDYMVLYGTNGHFKLVTSDVVDDLDGNAANDVRHTVTSFENYWKTNPTAANVIHNKYNSFTVGSTPTAAQIEGALTTGTGAMGWHTYSVWANGSTWASSSKSFGYGPHWFKTIDVGTESGGVYNGDFDLVEYELDGALILLDQHGWEVMRKPITNRTSDKAAYATAIKKYDSPMVKKYHFWTNFIKEDGYHKFKPIRGQSNASKNAQHKGEGASMANYPEVFSTGTLSDIYVTYEVLSIYGSRYTGAETEEDVRASKYLVSQGTNYAKTTDGTNITPEPVANVNLADPSSIGNELLWYVKPNFNIDTEMGYKYSGSYDEKTQEETESDYYNNPTNEEAVYDTKNGQNGFDPYNLQIESVEYPGKLFTTNATDAVLDGSGGMESLYDDQKTVTLKSYTRAFDASDYYNIGTGYQILHVTNSTFMAISDGNGNIRLMPRFDHQNVETAFITLDEQQSAANANDNGSSSTQTTLFVPSVTLDEILSSDEITDMNGNYVLSEDFDITCSVGTAEDPFTGTIDGKLRTIDGVDFPLIGYARGATIKNVILKDVKISQDGPVGAIAGTADGYTRIYNCGILPTKKKYVASEETSFLESTGGTNSYCGGLVGWLKGDSRVINCFSYAKITGGTDVAGIVGHNETVYTDGGVSYGSTTQTNNSKYYRLKTAVVNCMFYGNITGGTNRWPVYGGAMMRNDIDNGINNYDFYRAEASLGLADNSHYNCSWPAKEEYLTSYEYYRYLLNSNRELCGWWVGAPSAPSDMTTVQVQAVAKDASLIAKWVRDPSIAPYPILKTAGKYPSVVNQAPRPGETNPQRIDPETKQWVRRATESTEWTDPKDAPKKEGQILGSISVKIQDGDEHDADDITKTFTITAMDIENNDFCYGKIQLPYYNSIFGDPSVEVDPNATLENRKDQWNSRYGGNYNDKVVVGWEISSPTGDNIPSITDQAGTDDNGVAYDHIFSTNAESGYNFADRYCTTKDEQRVFAQGGYYYVPYGVTAITITAKWATAIYLDNSSNHDYDKVCMSQANDGKRFLPAGTRPTTLANGQTVITNDINGVIPSGGSVYENAIVLVGNHQYRRLGADIIRTSGNNTDGCTIMSADFDMDEEPDYCLIWQLGTGTTRQKICPIRFDFLPVVEIGMAMKQNTSTHYYSLGCYHPRGHFEVTETSLIHFGQFEFGSSLSVQAPLILNGGIYDQYCKGKNANGASNDKINYVIVGGNIYLPSFTPGAHLGNAVSTRHCPVNVIGGRINNLYLTGNYSESVTSNADNPHCYIDGGNFKQVAAAGKEGITGNVFFKIAHSIIKEFYGGSTLGNKYVTGKIDVTIDNSYVTKYCGGPKFSNLEPSDINSVTTNATGTTFGVYYGGGNGGSSYMQYDYADATVNDATATFNWGTTGKLNNYTARQYRNTAPIGYHGDYEMEIVNSSTGTTNKQAIFRTYMYSVQFASTDTGPITNNLTDCKVLTNFYGGGNLGGVKGSVTSTLSGNTRVEGSVFGAGYSASVPEVTIYNKDKTPPTINVYTGIITPTPDPDPASTSTTYTWTNKTSLGGKTLKTSDPTVTVDGINYFFTEESLENLGTVNGNVILSLEGKTRVMCKYFDEDGLEDSGKSGGVFGGGAQSAVNGSTTVYLSGEANISGDVFGGGDQGVVTGSATVEIQNAAPTIP